MKASAVLVMAAGALLLGCESRTGVQPATEWSATLVAQPGFGGISGTTTATATASQIQVTTNLAGVPQGSVMPWHIHFGTCDDDQGIVGAAAAYPHLEPDAAGNATASANVAAGLLPGQPYMVNVHASPQDLATIVACGPLIMD